MSRPPRAPAPDRAPAPVAPSASSGPGPGADAVPRERARATLAELRASGRPGPVDLAGLDLVDADLAGLDLTGADLSGADLSRADLTGATLFRAKLAGATLFRARLDRAELSGADLTGANLEQATLGRAGLGMARCAEASFVGADLTDATLSEADLAGADLRLATLRRARLCGARLGGAILAKADLAGADLSEADVAGTVFDGADLRGCVLRGLHGFARARWVGVDLREIDFTGAHLCRRTILDQNYIAEFRAQGRTAELVYRVWWATSDCGRSLLRWALCTCALAFVFAGVYPFLDVDYGAHRTPLSPLYYSVVTLTTLGYGDVLPASVAAQVVAMVEVVTGYFMLGGLLSILSNKLARRAD